MIGSPMVPDFRLLKKSALRAHFACVEQRGYRTVAKTENINLMQRKGFAAFRSYSVYISLSEKAPKLLLHTFWKLWLVARP
jgi:hypothetical protein